MIIRKYLRLQTADWVGCGSWVWTDRMEMDLDAFLELRVGIAMEILLKYIDARAFINKCLLIV